MRFATAVLRRVVMDFKDAFAASYGQQTQKDAVILELVTESGVSGFGECAASPAPLYTEETNQTAWHMLADHFLPLVLGQSFTAPEDLGRVRQLLARFKGNRMAKAAVETAVWDAFSATYQRPLPQLLGATRDVAASGVSIGIQPDIPTLLHKVEAYLAMGFRRVKLKVQPGWDLAPLRAVRQAFGDISLAADANGAYGLSDVDHLRRFDEYGLQMIEQPFAHDDLLDHAALQRVLSTPVCLDESIRSAEDVRKAVQIGACRVVNLKLGRVGGFAEALDIHQLCRTAGIDLWCGGMMETGIGRLHAVALSGLPGFTLPGDIGPSSRYFEEDLIDPPLAFTHPGELPVERVCGVASRVRRDRLEAWTVQKQEIRVS